MPETIGVSMIPGQLALSAKVTKDVALILGRGRVGNRNRDAAPTVLFFGLYYLVAKVPLGNAVQQLNRELGKGLLIGGVKLPLTLAELGLID